MQDCSTVPLAVQPDGTVIASTAGEQHRVTTSHSSARVRELLGARVGGLRFQITLRYGMVASICTMRSHSGAAADCVNGSQVREWRCLGPRWGSSSGIEHLFMISHGEEAGRGWRWRREGGQHVVTGNE